MMTPIPLTRDICLIGGGHSHALVLRMWAMRPLPGARLSIINPGPMAAYSGMLPGFVAGHYTRDELMIDLPRLAHAAGARFIDGAVESLDLDHHLAHVPGRPALGFDIASIDIGITTELPDLPGFAEHGIPAKPLGDFAQAWEHFAKAPSGPIAVIGGGIAGAELALAMAHRTGQHVHLIDRSEPLQDLAPSAKARVLRALDQRGVQIHAHSQPTRVTPQGVEVHGAPLIPAHFVTAAAAPRAQLWPDAAGLDCRDGFICVNDRLQSSDPQIFAAGDCAHLRHAPRPKAGVFAVRAAQPLFENLRAAAMERPLRPFHPQKRYLKLVSLGNKTALATRGRLALSGATMWRWKDRIDRRFMRKLQDLPDMTPALPHKRAADMEAEILCAGCGAKVDASTLSATIADHAGAPRSDVALIAGDDAGLLRIGGQHQVITLDQLRALTPDWVEMTRIAAHHALGDIWAMGAMPQSCLLNITLPRQSPALQRRAMAEIMASAHDVMTQAGAAIIGGHSAMGAEASIGFTITGLVDRNPILVGGARAGDALIVTKAIGSGVIMAGHMRGQTPGDHLRACLRAMQQDHSAAAQILRHAHAMTDVTGFGLAGHLKTMARAAGLGARVDVAQVPVMPGALALAQRGIRSSLWADNRANAQAQAPSQARADLMFDPQTAGGLLAALPADQAAPITDALRALGYDAAHIGHLCDQPDIVFT